MKNIKTTKKSAGAGKKSGISSAVIHRLPRYFRYLRELMQNNVLRISSNELSERMNATASQIRQDFNCFGEFGQQGYGYNVKYLHSQISEILGVSEHYNAVIIGTGNLGRALARSKIFVNRGMTLTALFDVDKGLVGKKFDDIFVYDMADLEKYCEENKVDIVVLTMPRDCAYDIAKRLSKTNIKGIWNFTGAELAKSTIGKPIENVHMGDSLMTLCYKIKSAEKAKVEK